MERKYRVAQQEVAWRRVDRDVLILHLRTGYYYSLNEVGARLWEELAGGASFARACTVIAGEFDADAATVRADAEKVLAELCREQLLQPA
ncbi:MAG TPA: PqqD family protein [bacterium]|nr:PqqD family protein [bacterium]